MANPKLTDKEKLDAELLRAKMLKVVYDYTLSENKLLKKQLKYVGDSANARIIAAAPAMYEALRDAKDYAELKLEGFRREYNEDHAMVQTPLRLLETINAALAQAEGQ